MPEGDAVRRTADRLDAALAGAVLTGSDFRVPHLATTDLTGATVLGTATHGKHLLTRLRTSGGTALTLHTHLKMEGSWRVVGVGERFPGPAHEVRVVLTTGARRAVGLRLGLVELLPTAEEHAAVGHLGPDLLGEWTGADRAEATSRLTRDPQRVLAEAVLDQTVVAGIGTIWLAESCFLHGVSPLEAVGGLPRPERFLERARSLLQSSLRTGRPVTTGDRRDPLWVYGRQRRPCRRCGGPVRGDAVGPPGRERTAWWCPRCQPLAADARST